MADTDAKKSDAPLAPPTGGERRALDMATVRKAEKGDAAALAEVREMLKRAGFSDALCGNVARESLWLLVNAYAGKNQVIREATTCKLAEMRAELSGPNPTALEKLLVERVLATWLHLHHIESVYTRTESMSLAQGLYYQKIMTAAQKRYLAAIRGLGELRKLALPAIQVNIAKKQVNVATAPVTAVSPTN